MAATQTYSNLILQPAYDPKKAVYRTVRLPVGGPYGVGGVYAKGLVLGSVTSTTPVSEVRTIAVTGSPTGFTGTFTFTNGGPTATGTLANAVDAVPTVAQFTTALEEIFGAGNVTVVKSTLSYAITFAGQLASCRIGGILTASFTYTAGTSPAFTHTRTTVGSCGSGQYEVQADGSSDGTQTPKAILRTNFASGPRGGNFTEAGQTDQPETPAAYFGGYFNAADLTGLTTTGLALFGRIAEGGALTDADAVVKIF